MAQLVFEKKNLRLTLLTDRLLRVERGAFTDRPTQTVWNRDLGAVDFQTAQKGNMLQIQTERVTFRVDLRRGAVCAVVLADGTLVRNFSRGNLLGTARTLDTANGAVKLQPGIQSRNGVAVIDDGQSLLLDEKADVLPRPACRDRYYFAYGRDHLAALQDFYRLTGPVPLIPKFALGNWWSRYKAYTQQEYRDLMQRFMDRRLPITVATIDMDWHWTDVLRRFGDNARPGAPRTKEEVLYNTILPGWTGYSWNTELFPDHRQLLDWLHEQHFKVTLNVHPSQGIRFFEDAYRAVCRRMGKDPENGECVPFDITDPAFRAAYFEELHHPMEAEGVDFWWIDWQQGTKTAIPGFDPLWALNHYHSRDLERRGKRPLILSRYAGLGSHRYPLGFSGDTVVTWKSLRFQPYFTSTAANAGYSWWSHDIGGHMGGVQDDELYLRWLQFGVFSPINRLHSSNSDYMGKEPWNRCHGVRMVAEDFLRLRHRLIPYLYTANYRTHTEGLPLCMPMYYRYSCPDAYKARDQYIFGGSLLVCPITRPMDRRLNMAYADVWLPEGRWTDIFNGRRYRGGGWVRMYRDLDAIPVLAPEGAIVPLYAQGEDNDLSLDQPLEVQIFRGNGTYELFEDDGETMDHTRGCYAITRFRLEEQGNTLRLIITPPENGVGLLPQKRKIRLKFRDVETEDREIVLEDRPATVTLTDIQPRKNPDGTALRTEILTRIQAKNGWKKARFGQKVPVWVQNVLSEFDALDR